MSINMQAVAAADHVEAFGMTEDDLRRHGQPAETVAMIRAGEARLHHLMKTGASETYIAREVYRAMVAAKGV